MNKTRLFDHKHNFLTDRFVYSCIVKNCDFKIVFDMPTYRNIETNDKWLLAQERDKSFEEHMYVEHGLDVLFKYDYPALVYPDIMVEEDVQE